MENRQTGAQQGAVAHRAHGVPNVILFVICALMVLSLAVMAGCRDTDALKEIIYDQNSDLVDYDNPTKNYINDSTADEESNAVSSLEVSDEEPDADQIQHLVVYSSDPNTDDYTAKKSAFSATPDFTGIEASEQVYFVKSDSVDAFEHAITPDNEDEEEEEDEQEQERQTAGSGTNYSESSTSSADSSSGVVSSGNSAVPEDDDGGASAGGEDEVESEDGDGDGLSSGEGVGDYKDYTLAFDISDPDADIPEADSIAACGQYALIVQMVGGKGALAATDASTLEDLDDAGVDVDAVKGWSGTGAKASSIDVKAIVSSGATLIVAENPKSYTKEMSTAEVEYLEEHGVSWVSLRDMCTSVNIKSNVETVGSMLQGSSKAAYGSSAESRAEHYVDFHDTCVENANGGLANDTVNGKKALQAENKADGLSYSDNDATYTVLVDLWDEDAKCALASYTFEAGCAYSSVGYATTPVSYYMQAGGTINNAAALVMNKTSSKEAPVLQFAGSGSWGSSVWKNTTLDSDDIYYKVGPLLDSGVDLASNTQLGKGLGSDTMPKLVVTTSSIKDAIVKSSSSSKSLYHANSYAGTGTVFGAVGITYSTSHGDTSLWSCIGSTAKSGTLGDANPTYPSGAIDEDDVLVNPSGYFCDWTQGTVESFLESGWVAAYVNGTYGKSDWRSDVSDFYEWAWDIDVSMSKITDQ